MLGSIFYVSTKWFGLMERKDTRCYFESSVASKSAHLSLRYNDMKYVCKISPASKFSYKIQVLHQKRVDYSANVECIAWMALDYFAWSACRLTYFFCSPFSLIYAASTLVKERCLHIWRQYGTTMMMCLHVCSGARCLRMWIFSASAPTRCENEVYWRITLTRRTHVAHCKYDGLAFKRRHINYFNIYITWNGFIYGNFGCWCWRCASTAAAVQLFGKVKIYIYFNAIPTWKSKCKPIPHSPFERRSSNSSIRRCSASSWRATDRFDMVSDFIGSPHYVGAHLVWPRGYRMAFFSAVTWIKI